MSRCLMRQLVGGWSGGAAGTGLAALGRSKARGGTGRMRSATTAMASTRSAGPASVALAGAAAAAAAASRRSLFVSSSPSSPSSRSLAVASVHRRYVAPGPVPGLAFLPLPSAVNQLHLPRFFYPVDSFSPASTPPSNNHPSILPSLHQADPTHSPFASIEERFAVRTLPGTPSSTPSNRPQPR